MKVMLTFFNFTINAEIFGCLVLLYTTVMTDTHHYLRGFGPSLRLPWIHSAACAAFFLQLLWNVELCAMVVEIYCGSED